MDKFKDEELDFLTQAKDRKGDNPNLNIHESKQDAQDDFNPDDYLDQKSLQRMHIGLWLSENRKKIIKFFVILLIIISIGFFSFSIYNLIIYLQSDNPNDFIHDNNLTQNQTQILPLSFSEISVLDNNLKNDLAISVRNSNERFYAKFDYCFLKGEVEVACGQDFILPVEEKYILSFDIDSLVASGDFSFVISKISWNRISRDITNYNSFYQDRFNLLVSDINFSSAIVPGVNLNNLNNLEFYIQNNSAYSYYEVPLNILVFNGEDLRGINKYIINNFYSGENKRINLSWSANLGGAQRVLILPAINIFDNSVFLRYRGN